MKALLVDDDMPTIEVIRDSIDWKAFSINTVQTAFNISDAKELIEQDVPDIIMCDIEMPKGSGIDLLKWIREKAFRSEFIFLTCHESFEFASIAINYNVVAYITKPFDRKKTEAAVAKAADAVINRNRLQEYSLYGTYWVDSRTVVEQGFWQDILFNNIPPKTDLIRAELLKRHICQDIVNEYYIVLSCSNRPHVSEGQWDDNSFKYAFCNLTSEILLDELDLTHVFSYIRNDMFYSASIVNGNAEINDIKSRCQKLIMICSDYLHCNTACYISRKVRMEHIAKTREELEELDGKNILSRSSVILQKDSMETGTKEQYALDVNLFTKLFADGEKIRIVTMLQKELEGLASRNGLDAVTLHSIRHDFMQIVYSVLNNNGIQAHRLFSDKASQRLFQASENTVFDMIKWAAFITDNTVDFLKEVQKSEGVVEKAKRFIHQNYTRDISREDIASSVFLTPDYLSKIFKTQTGVHIKDYINDLRIKKAKELLLQSSLSISEISSRTGFESFSYFSTVFKKATGDTPFSFRKMHKTSVS